MANYVFRTGGSDDPAAPLFLVFHGTGGDENQFFDLAGELLPGGRIVAPRGDVSENGALRYFRRTGEGVYDMADLANRTETMIGFVREQQAGRSGKVVGLGYSNGANILASALFKAPDLFDASVLMHPLIPFEPRAADFTGRKVLLTGGVRDPMAPAAMTETLAEYFRRNGADAQLVWHQGGHELRPEELRAAQQFLSPMAQIRA
jgi:phospholipase/carboxylesterase